MQYKTHEIAQACNVTVNTVRNWCRDYAQWLSPGATVTSGNRVFNARDLEVLKYIAQLRTEGMTAPAIRLRLGETTFPEVEDHPAASPSTTALEASVTVVTSPTQSAAPLVALDDHEKRLVALEHSRNYGAGLIALGILIGLALAGLFEIMAWLAVRMR